MAAQIPFRRALDFDYGVVARLSPLVRRVIAKNPSAFTLYGTGTYIIGHGKVAVIDAGPADVEHVEAVLRAVAGEEVTHQLITHTHIDHSPGAAILKERIGAPTYGFGPHGGSREGPRVEEGGDFDFVPDHVLSDGDVVEGDGWTMTAVHTPGHTSNHLCFALAEENLLFTGDHVMGWSTTVISPPDGDMSAYMASLEKLLGRSETRYWPTHGPAIDEPTAFVSALIEHRHDRERQILDCLSEGPKTIPEMVARMYADIDPGLHRAAGRSVLAHLIRMTADGRVGSDGPVDENATYRR